MVLIQILCIGSHLIRELKKKNERASYADMGTSEEHGPENTHSVGHSDNFGVYSNCIEKSAETFEHQNYTTNLSIQKITLTFEWRTSF